MKIISKVKKIGLIFFHYYYHFGVICELDMFFLEIYPFVFSFNRI